MGLLGLHNAPNTYESAAVTPITNHKALSVAAVSSASAGVTNHRRNTTLICQGLGKKCMRLRNKDLQSARDEERLFLHGECGPGGRLLPGHGTLQSSKETLLLPRKFDRRD